MADRRGAAPHRAQRSASLRRRHVRHDHHVAGGL